MPAYTAPPSSARPSKGHVLLMRAARQPKARGVRDYVGAGDTPVADGAVRGQVPSVYTPGWAASNEASLAYAAAATAVDDGAHLYYGTSYFCFTPCIADNPLNCVQLCANSVCPQAAPSCCPSCYGRLCGTPCTACLQRCTRGLLCCQCYKSFELETFETAEDSLAALLALQPNEAVPEELAGVWSFLGNPWGEQLISTSTMEWDAEKRILRGDHAFMREGWVERGDACGACQQCVMATGFQPGLYFTFDEALHNAVINLTLDCRCCPGVVFWRPCASACGAERFPCVQAPGYCIPIPTCINNNTWTVIGGAADGGGPMDSRNRQIGACGIPLTCFNAAYSTGRVARRDGTRIERNWELYTKWVAARAGTLRATRMKTAPYAFGVRAPHAEDMQR